MDPHMQGPNETEKKLVGRFLPATLAALMAVMVGTPSSAATMLTQTVAIPATTASVTAPGGTAAVNFAQFNPTLGTLLGVTLSFSATSNTTLTVANNTPSARNWNVAPQSTASLSGNGFNLSDTETGGSLSFVLDRRIDAGTPRTAQVVFNGVYSDSDSLASGFVPFLGTGNVQFTFAALNQWTVSGSGGGRTFSPDSYTGNATLTYDYQVMDIEPAPEPAAWAMMIAGFAAVGAAARRRRPITPITLG
jgi:hypothetical protein